MHQNNKTALNEMEKILEKENMGFLGLSRHGIPYVIPMTYGYENGKILFHCALKGTKLDIIKKNPQVCFTVGMQSGEIIPHEQGAKCNADHDSVMCFGEAHIIEDPDERCIVLNRFNRCLQPGAKEIKPEEISNCLAVEIRIKRMTGRQQRKGLERTYWEYNF